MLRSYYGIRHGSVTNDDENISRERAAESARAQDRMENKLDAGNTRNRGETLDSKSKDSAAAPLPTIELTTHPQIPGWEHQVPINRPAHHSRYGESHIEIILGSSLGVHPQPLNTHTIEVTRSVDSAYVYMYCMHAVPIPSKHTPWVGSR